MKYYENSTFQSDEQFAFLSENTPMEMSEVRAWDVGLVVNHVGSY